MKTQDQLTSVWNTVSQWLLSPTALCYVLYMVMVVLAVFGLHLLDTPTFAKLSISTLHMLSHVPYADPFP